jgi:hypothetical protein
MQAATLAAANLHIWAGHTNLFTKIPETTMHYERRQSTVTSRLFCSTRFGRKDAENRTGSRFPHWLRIDPPGIPKIYAQICAAADLSSLNRWLELVFSRHRKLRPGADQSSHYHRSNANLATHGADHGHGVK